MTKDRTWIEINTKALTHNFSVFRKLTPKSMVMSVVKSNAYGHDIVQCAKLFDSLGTEWFGVDDLDEALLLRKAGIKKPVLVLGYTLPSRYTEAKKENISITVSSLDSLSQCLEGQKIHLKIDTGLHRQGVLWDEVDTKELWDLLAKVSFEGIYSHFAGAESSKFNKYSEKQTKRFIQVYELCREHGFTPLKHMSGSAATFCFPNARFDIVRAGVSLYGYWPSSEIQECIKEKLFPALTWKTGVAEVKQVKKGEKVGYDLSETLSRDTKLAIIPIGYWHSYTRHYSKRAHMLIGGKRCKVMGRVSMDMCAVDVTEVKKIYAGDEVVLLGKQGKEEVTAEELGELSGTINYEIVTRINPLIKRIFV